MSQYCALIVLCRFAEAGKFTQACEGEMVIESCLEKVRILIERLHLLARLIAHRFLTSDLQIPYFNAPIYLENKTQIGKVEEILGPIHKYVRAF